MKEHMIKVNYATAWLMGIDPIATGKRLRDKRRAFSLTLDQLSELFEQGGESVCRQAISKWESGKSFPSLPHIVFLSELYHCSLDELVATYRHSQENEEEDQLVPLYNISVRVEQLYRIAAF